MAESDGPDPGRSIPIGRRTQTGVPPTRRQRQRLSEAVADRVAAAGAVPPLPLAELEALAGEALAASGLDERHLGFATVLAGNETWRDTLATIPFSRRLLLLPQCLRDESKCPADLDEFGLVCRRCGACPIGDLQTQAETLGYVVLVAEGSAMVTSLIETGRVEAIIGVSCLSVLQQVFPYMEAAAIPGLAIPLLRDGCANTAVDLDWVLEAIHLATDDRARRLDLDRLQRRVGSWFDPPALEAILGPPGSQTERIARDWVARSGKRWRPFLTVCAYQALTDDGAGNGDDDLKRLALAVECFHKASLVHDDIEDNDAERYGRDAVHVAWGVPVALNVGDFLLGEGYRLIAACDVPPDRKAEMLAAAASGHRELAIGQGAELCWRRHPGPLTIDQVLDIFRRKTAPAFQVALTLGVIHAGADGAVRRALADYSEALGIAYQIRDDLHDDGDDAPTLRPSVLLAIAHERADAAQRRVLDRLWRAADPGAIAGPPVAKLFADLKVHDVARRLLDDHKERAIRALGSLGNARLKGLLRRVIAKIFNDTEAMGWCREREAGHAGGGPSGAEGVA